MSQIGVTERPKTGQVTPKLPGNEGKSFLNFFGSDRCDIVTNRDLLKKAK